MRCTPIIFLEGPTDELYFKKAAEVLGFQGLVPMFRQIGEHMKNGDSNGGQGAMKKAVSIYQQHGSHVPLIFLYDCDTKRPESVVGNIYEMTMPFFSNRILNKGTENMLSLDGYDTTRFYSEKASDYGCHYQTFEKMKLCNFICNLPDEQLVSIFDDMKPVLNRINEIVNCSE